MNLLKWRLRDINVSERSSFGITPRLVSAEHGVALREASVKRKEDVDERVKVILTIAVDLVDGR